MPIGRDNGRVAGTAPRVIGDFENRRPDNPLTRAFGRQPFTYTDEYYRMTDTGLQGTYSRDKVHVLLSVGMGEDARLQSGARVPCIRQSNDYAVSWIRGYGKGRVFYAWMGHTPQMFMDPKMNGFLLAAVQLLLGDLAPIQRQAPNGP